MLSIYCNYGTGFTFQGEGNMGRFIFIGYVLCLIFWTWSVILVSSRHSVSECGSAFSSCGRSCSMEHAGRASLKHCWGTRRWSVHCIIHWPSSVGLQLEATFVNYTCIVYNFLIRIHRDGEPSGYLENPDNGICIWKLVALAVWSSAVTIYSMSLCLNISTTPDLKS